MDALHLSEELAHGSHLGAASLAHADLEVRVDDGDGEQDTGSGAESADEVGANRERTDGCTTKGSGGGDDTLELLVHGGVAVTGHDHLVVLELLCDLARARAGDLDPGLGEERAGGEGEGDVDGGVDGVADDLPEVVRRRHVVGDAADGVKLSAVLQRLPNAEQLDEEVGGEAGGEHLADDEHVGGEGGLEHDGHVRGVEELDRVGAALAAEAVGLDGDLDAEALEVDDHEEDEEGGEEVHDVGQTVTVECLLERAGLVVPGEEEVEEGDEGALELGATAGVDGGGREGLPDDGLADVGGDEERDTGAETVALLEELVEKDDDETGDNELENEQEADTSAEVLGLSVETGEHVDGGLSEGDDESKELLGTAEEGAILLEAEVDLDEVGACEELHDHARGDDGRDAEFHEQRDLGRDEEDGEHDGGPHDTALEGDFAFRRRDLGQHGHERPHERQEPDWQRRKRGIGAATRTLDDDDLEIADQITRRGEGQAKQSEAGSLSQQQRRSEHTHAPPLSVTDVGDLEPLPLPSPGSHCAVLLGRGSCAVGGVPKLHSSSGDVEVSQSPVAASFILLSKPRAVRESFSSQLVLDLDNAGFGRLAQIGVGAIS
ncbi:hypothetical protein L1887_54967 [Cichorium endivia]|nr:hypothetical protein L1887_54967 [Cichorium endivia]